MSMIHHVRGLAVAMQNASERPLQSFVSAAASYLRPHLQTTWWAQQVPNVLSGLRIPLSPLVAMAMYMAYPWLMQLERREIIVPIVYVTVLVALAMTDKIDGMLARELGCVSRIGKALDPIGDKVFFASMSIALCYLLDSSAAWVYLILLLFIEACNLAVGTVNAYFITRWRISDEGGAGIEGKVKMTVETLTLVTGYALVAHPIMAAVAYVTLLILSVHCAVWSLWAYIVRAYKAYGEHRSK